MPNLDLKFGILEESGMLVGFAASINNVKFPFFVDDCGGGIQGVLKAKQAAEEFLDLFYRLMVLKEPKNQSS